LAYENFDLGEALTPGAPAAAARLLEKSLRIPISRKDTESVEAHLRVSMVPANLNLEKQLRLWTKQLLAQNYLALKRPELAQPLAEEIVAMKGADVLLQDVHQLAGEVQRESGRRVVEGEILRNEAAQQRTAKYWLERASYFQGRSDEALVRDTYRKALAALPYAKDRRLLSDRFEIVRAYSFFLKEGASKSELEALLRDEFSKTGEDSDYGFAIARLIADDEFELDKLRHSLLVRQPNIVARLLQRRANWDNEEQKLIEDIVRGDEITSTEKNTMWTALEKLVSDPGSTRAYRLGEAMLFRGAVNRAKPLFEAYLKSGVKNEFIDNGEVLRNVVAADCQNGNWRAAEQLLMANMSWAWDSASRALGMLAATAAKQGATADSVRLWRMKSNVDRRDLDGLDEIARTEARASLQTFYLQMKKEEPLASAPELALARLKSN
jgi:hypothetical protein